MSKILILSIKVYFKLTIFLEKKRSLIIVSFPRTDFVMVVMDD